MRSPPLRQTPIQRDHEALGIPGRHNPRRGPAAWTDDDDRRPVEMMVSRTAIGNLKIMDDPEAIFQEAWLFCDVGELERGLGLLQRSVARGYFVAQTLSDSQSFDALRSEPAFQELLAESRAGREQALAAFRDGGGERLLGR